MKKKHKAGLKLLSAIEGSIEKLKLDIKLTFYLFRGYGTMVQHKFKVEVGN